MKINHFKAKNVQGYLNFDIEFDETLNFLIGRNGSGKTSALKLIVGLLTPSFLYLCQTAFDEVELICSSKKSLRDIKVKATKPANQNKLKIRLENSKRTEESEFDIIQTKFSEIDSIYEEKGDKIRFLIDYFENQDVVKSIKQLPTPSFLALERRIYDNKKGDIYYEKEIFKYQRKPLRYSINDSINISLEEIQNLIFNYIREVPLKQYNFTEEFKNKIISLSFDYYDDFKNYYIDWRDSEQINKRLTEIVDKRAQLELAVGSLNVENVKKQISEYFKKLEYTLSELLKRTSEKSFKDFEQNEYNLINQYFINSPQLERLDQIIKFSKEYQQKLTRIYEPIQRLESIINSFYSESAKKLKIESNGEMIIELSNKRKSSIYEVSSGEKQILVMIAHLIFFEEVQKNTGIFIIDEPELSLHIAWQTIFVESIKKASPNTQFILATHSPAIIAELNRTMFCKDLSR